MLNVIDFVHYISIICPACWAICLALEIYASHRKWLPNPALKLTAIIGAAAGVFSAILLFYYVYAWCRRYTFAWYAPVSIGLYTLSFLLLLWFIWPSSKKRIGGKLISVLETAWVVFALVVLIACAPFFASPMFLVDETGQWPTPQPSQLAQPPAPLALLTEPESLDISPSPITMEDDHADMVARRRDDRPRLETIRVFVDNKGHRSSLRIRIRLLWLNETAEDVTLEDMHLRIYERRTVRPLVMTLGWGGELELTPQNTLRKNTQHRYFLPPGDGWEYDLTFRMNTDIDGGRVIFGIIADYYTPLPSAGLRKSAVTSTCLYMLRYGGISDFGPGVGPTDVYEKRLRFTVVDDDYISKVSHQYAGREEYLAFVSELAELLKRHKEFRPTPRY